MRTDRPGVLARPAAAGGALIVRTDAALARARLLMKQPAPVAVMVAVPATCARVGVTFLLSGRREGDKLVVSAAGSLPKTRGTAPSGDHGAGYFSAVEFPANWYCPGCRRPHSGATWACDCAAYRGALHVCGDAGRAGICACGRSETLHFAESAGADLRGSASTPRATLQSSNASARPPALPSVRVPPLLLPIRKG